MKKEKDDNGKPSNKQDNAKKVKKEMKKAIRQENERT